MNGETNHATAELIVYDYSITNGVTNALVTLTGHPVVSNRNGDMHGDVITCDLIRNTIAFRNYGGSILLQKTNAPGLMDQFKPSRTNSAPNAMNRTERRACVASGCATTQRCSRRATSRTTAVPDALSSAPLKTSAWPPASTHPRWS